LIIAAAAVAAALYFTVFQESNDGESNVNNGNNNEENDSVTPPSAPVPPITSPPASNPTSEFLCNGLLSLCDKPVNEVSFATPHNAESSADTGTLFVPNHALSLEIALQNGYRGMNLDVGKCNGELQLVHGYCVNGYRDPTEVFTNIATFLNDNPREVILMTIEINSDTGGAVTVDEIYALLQSISGFLDLVYVRPESATGWPTLEELIDADTRLLIFHYNGDRNCQDIACPPGLMYWWDYGMETEFQFANPSSLEDTASSCKVTRGLDGTRDFLGVNVFTEIPSDSSCEILNAYDFLSNHIRSCAELNYGHIVNVVMVDCHDVGEVLQVVKEYNEAF
jgi:hypothetical protein